MTDIEIKKNLEDLLKLMLHEGDLQRTSIVSKALDLIKRKDVEIERLNIELQSMRSAANSYKMHYEIAKSEVINEFEKEIKYVKENEKYDDYIPIVDIDLCENVLNITKLQQVIIDTLRTLNKSVASETIKEVEKRLKSKLQWDVEFDSKIVFESDIDNLIKEMEELE